MQDNPKDDEARSKDDIGKSIEEEKALVEKESSTAVKRKRTVKSKGNLLLEVNESSLENNEKKDSKVKAKSKGSARRTTTRKSKEDKSKAVTESDLKLDLIDKDNKSNKTRKSKEKTNEKASSKRINIIKNKEAVLEKEKILSDGEAERNEVKKVLTKVDKAELTSFNTYLFHQGKNYEAYNILGAHVKKEKNKIGIQFATWAPNAKEVYVVGAFNDFEVKDEFKLEKITENGLWKGFFTEVKTGDKYKYCIIEQNGEKGEYKADPYAIQSELRPDNASIVYKPKNFKWTDKTWINKRSKINALEEPLNIYEVHLGSWKRRANGEFFTYEEIGEELSRYMKEMRYTHVEIMPLVEHPLDASWGYQGTGYYSPTSRYGNIEGLKSLINKLHEANIGVIMDWVPGHFCKDAHGLYRFDGTPTYEYQEEWRAENKGWGTCNFDLGKPEVKSYLISNALYWFREFHIDGLRVDAVSSILYLDYSRAEGEWIPNKNGGNGNLEAIDFLKELNKAVFNEYKAALMIAEESTAWPNVTKPPANDGLGFNFKWNMGWMNDTLEYVEIDTKYRKYNHKNITFSMMYNYAENYLLPLSHDEVVHEKKSLVDKMWGDEWNKFAGLRVFIGYMMGHPGKKLIFMGCEFGQRIEWREHSELEWGIIEESDIHKKTQLFFKDINNLYLNNRAFWELDHDYRGFNWIEPDNNEQSILIFARRSRNDEDTLVFVINFTSIVYYDYKIGVPFLGSYEEIFNTDDSKYGGSGQVMGEILIAEKMPFHNQPYSLTIKVPPMAALILKINEISSEQEKKLIDEISIKEVDELK
ncbi:1,4-alpha-glucan-branching enzyme [Clostridium sp. DL-VIII]|uniref:1,4-alpha-glucan branching protein GlgB n=1 Tax=Clostridium sp. DL-VIII TaxID=641107 RepID=UPI00023B0365|nr:1,4-alpha-glucan branching protein GlgB [Clostridium sp. DL-VIII]EHJ02343.1 1,4-alpha-glucan-branching enzyme [Clostridium sp. DL-VIII]